MRIKNSTLSTKCVCLTMVVFLSVILAVIGANAESGSCGESLTWTLDGSGTLTISGTGEMVNYGRYEAPWRDLNVKTLVINSGVTSIGENAFNSNMSQMQITSVSIPDTVKTIGEAAFEQCQYLTSIELPDNVTTLSEAAFWNCYKLEKCNIPKGLKAIPRAAFGYCALKEVYIPNSVTSIGAVAFVQNESLTKVTISSSVKTFTNNPFQQCSNVSIYAPEGSEAQTYASRAGIPFFPIEDYYKEIIESNIHFDDLHYNFDNSESGLKLAWKENIPLAIYKMHFSNSKAWELFLDQFGNLIWNGFGGWCCGFASSSILFNTPNSGLELSPFGVKKIKDLEVGTQTSAIQITIVIPPFSETTNLTAKWLIESLQVMQYKESFKNARVTANKNNIGKGGLNTVVNAIKEGIKSNRLQYVFIKGEEGGHALVGYKYEKKDDNHSLIYVYDCNWPFGWGRTIELTNDAEGNYTGWSYQLFDDMTWSSEKEGKIGYVSNADIISIWKARITNKKLKNAGERQYTTVRGNNWKITSSSGTLAEMSNGSFVSYNSQIQRCSSDISPTGVSLIYSDDADFTITNTESGSFEVKTAGSMHGAFVKTEAKSVSFEMNDSSAQNKVLLDCKAGDTFDVTFVSDLSAASGKEELKISGKSEGSEVVIGMSGSDVVINNCTDVSISINDQPVQNPEEISKNINFYDVSLEYTEAAYTGKAIKPGIIVKGKDLKEGTDYKITYENNIGSSSETTTATAIIQGLGEYTGTKTLLFTILPEGKALKNSKISAIKDQVYTGKAITPKFTVMYKGTKLIKDTDYTITWKDNKNIGTATLTVSGKGMYTGEKKVTFKIIPKAVKLSSLKAGSKQLTVKWKKGSGIDGYEIEYSLKKNFKGAKTVTISKMKTTSTEIKKLKAKKTYYVRIRTFKKVKGKNYYSEWSKVLSKKVK